MAISCINAPKGIVFTLSCLFEVSKNLFLPPGKKIEIETTAVVSRDLLINSY